MTRLVEILVAQCAMMQEEEATSYFCDGAKVKMAKGPS